MSNIWHDLHHGNVSDGELRALGVGNLAHIIASLRGQEESSSSEIKRLADEATSFGNQVVDLKAQGDYAIDPTNLMPTISDRMKFDEIPPLSFDTTFRTCVKCAHGTAFGSREFGNRQVACSLFSRVGEEKKLPYSSDCEIRELPPARMQTLKNTFTERLEAAKSKRNDIRALIARLQEIKKTTPEMPLFPEFRDSYHFLYGDRVVLYVYYATFRKGSRWHWVQGVVLPPSLESGYYVTARLDEPLVKPRWKGDENDDLYKTWQAFTVRGLNAHSPFLMHLSDFEQIASLAHGHMFRTRWLSEVGGDDIRRADDMRGSTVDIDMRRYGERLSQRYLSREDAVEQLMDVDEALAILSLAVEDLSPAGIVTRYRELREARRGAIGTNIDRAKDTLLVRLRGAAFKKK